MTGHVFDHRITGIEARITSKARWINIECEGGEVCSIWLREDQARLLRDACEELYPSLKQPEPPAPESADAALEALADREATRAGNVYPF